MDEMTTEREGRILEAAIAKYGEDVQVDKAVEEMSELTKALLKARQIIALGYGLHESMRSDILEECADVQIMLNQLQLIYGDCTEHEIVKLERLEARIDGKPEPRPTWKRVMAKMPDGVPYPAYICPRCGWQTAYGEPRYCMECGKRLYSEEEEVRDDV